ncbi:MAG: alpha-L-fucosidase [Saprospiraceae bacterium]|nr:alpha-L-fucosidase [Saprospiraceae bacterium]
MNTNRNISAFQLVGLVLLLSIFSACVNLNQQASSSATAQATEPYEANWESLRQYEIPEWFQDAKFGIFIHWGPYAVPAFGSEWYPRLMYMDEKIWNANFEVKSEKPSGVYKHHVKTYGHPGEFGYKDFIPMFKGEHFDAAEWIDLFVKSGAKYVVPVAEHHDAFAMYKSNVTRWNSVDMGPKQDILGELFAEARKKGLKTGASSHLAFNWAYFNRKEEFDNWDPQYDDLYGVNREKTDQMSDAWRETWWNRTKDIIDNYQPDLLWFDFYLDKEAFRPNHPELAAYYYNKGLEWNKEVVLQNKNFHGFESYPPGTNVLDLERGKMSDIQKSTWQTDTSIGANSWGYVTNWISKTPNTLIDDLVDIVSKNGCLLLNVGPKADGTIPEDQQAVLMEIGKWLETNGKAVFGSRPWRVFGEGPTAVAVGHHTEGKNKDLTAQDFRFTTNDEKLYAIAMDWSTTGETIITELAQQSANCQWDIEGVKLLGYDGKLEWEHTKDGLEIKLPEEKPGDHAFVFEVDFGDASKDATQNLLD